MKDNDGNEVEELESEKTKKKLFEDFGVDSEEGDPMPAENEEDPKPGEGEEDPKPGEGEEDPDDKGGKPKEGEADPKPGDSEEEEEEEEIPESADEKTKAAFIKARKKRQEERDARLAAEQENEKLRQEFEEYKNSQKAPERSTPTPDEKPQLTAAQKHANDVRVLDILARAEKVIGGDLDPNITDAAAAQKLKSQAIAIVETLTPQELAMIGTKAQRGELGEMSEQIVELTRNQLPFAQERVAQQETAAKEQADEQAKAAEGYNKVRAEALSSVYETYPQLKEQGQKDERTGEVVPKSKEFIFCMDWIEKNVGTAEKPGWLRSSVDSDPRNLKNAFDLAMKDFNAAAVKRKAAEGDKAKETLNKIKNPDAGGAGGGGGGDNQKSYKRASDKTKAEIIQKYGVTDHGPIG